jgi:hypothetical protein
LENARGSGIGGISTTPPIFQKKSRVFSPHGTFAGVMISSLDQYGRVSFDHLFQEAGGSAVGDIKSAEDSESYGFLDKTWWHWLGAVIHVGSVLICRMNPISGPFEDCPMVRALLCNVPRNGRY